MLRLHRALELTDAAPDEERASLGLLARLRQRLLPRRITFTPGIAQLLLINRLKAHSLRKMSDADVLERAARIVFVTCKNWFSSPVGKIPSQRKPL